MRNVSHKSCWKNHNIHFMFSNFFLLRKSCRLWDNVGKYCITGQSTDDNVVHAHCMLDTEGCKCTHSGFVTLIAFPLQHWLHECASLLRFTYIACLVRLSFVARLYIRPNYSFNVFRVTSLCRSTSTTLKKNKFEFLRFHCTSAIVIAMRKNAECW
jgi:hypothetical protein